VSEQQKPLQLTVLARRAVFASTAR